jgi:hypothetical protein
MFEWLAFIIALTPGLYKLLKGEPITWAFIATNTLFSGFISLIIAFFGGFLFPAEALVLTKTNIGQLLLSHFFSAFIGAIVVPVGEYIAKLKFA